MKIYTKIILDKDNNLIEEEYYYYSGSLTHAGIHYTFGANKGNKLMEKKAKKEKKLAAHHAVDLLRDLLEAVEADARGQRRQTRVPGLLRDRVQDLLRVVALRLGRLRNLHLHPENSIGEI